jgi:hypothetical protein
MRLCRPGRQASRAQPRGKPGFSTLESSSGRETDSPLEGSGFEPSVPLPRLSSIRAVRAEIIGRSTDVFRRDREFDVSALQGRLSTSSQSQCSTDPGLIAGTWHRPLFLTRDRWFESGSLQRRVCELSVPRRRTLVLVLGWSAIAQIPKLIGRELESTRCVRASCILAPEPTAAKWPPGCTARQARWFGRLRARLLTVARLGSHEIDGLLLLHPHEQPAR